MYTDMNDRHIYKNLSLEDSIRFEVLTMAMAHWPADRKCTTALPWAGSTHYHSGNPCYYGFVFEQYDELYMKEFGSHA